MRRLLIATIPVFLLASTPAFGQVAHGQGGEGRGSGGSTSRGKGDEAKAHFARGVELYDENDFANALIEFRRAYEIAQDYHILFNVAQTHYQLQNYAGALDAFQRYLTQGGVAIPKERRAFVEKEVQKLAGRVAMVRITVNIPNADVMVDDEKVGTSPLDHAIMVSQGKRKISAAIDGKPTVDKTIEVAGGDSADVTLDIQEEAPPPPPPPPPPPVEMRRHIPWAAWGVTGGLFVVWGATGVLALVFSSSFQSKLGTYPETASDIGSAQDLTRGFALASDIALGCTVVSAGVALVLTLIAKPEPVEKKGVTARFDVGPGGFSVSGRF